MNYDDYILCVESGEIITNEYIKLAVKRFRRFQNRDDIYFNEKKVEHVISFISNIKHYLGKHAGKPFILEPWQEFILANIFGWCYTETNLRVTKNVFLFMSRKQGKSAFSSALALYLLIADGENSPEIVFAANSREQAKILLDISTQFSKSLDPSEKHLKIYRYEISFKANNGKATIVSSDAGKLDGRNLSAYIIDEYHEAKNSKMSDVLSSSQGMREQPLGIIISTAGFDLNSPCYSLYNTSIEILRGVKDDDSFLPILYTLDENDNWYDKKNWIKSNPNLNITVTSDFIEQQIIKAKNNSSDEVGVKTKTLNMWCSTADFWISHDKIVKSTEKLDISKFKGKSCYVGVDLASVNDLTAVTYMFVDDDKYYFITDYYLPLSALSEHPQKEYYKSMYHTKQLKITDGNSTDYDYISSDIQRVNEKCPVVGVYYDPYNSIQWAIDMTNRGFNLQPYSQSISNFNRPTKEFLRLILSNKVVLDDNTLTRFCFDNVIIFRDHNENEKPKKLNVKSKIDGVISILEALGGYLATPKYEFATYVL